jgi:hypothetical protein
MKGHRHTIRIVIALVLIPVVIGLMPLNFIHKMEHGHHTAPGRGTVIKCYSCPRDSLVSHVDFELSGLGWVSVDRYRDTTQFIRSQAIDTFLRSTLPEYTPLRC